MKTIIQIKKLNLYLNENNYLNKNIKSVFILPTLLDLIPPYFNLSPHYSNFARPYSILF